MFTGYLLLPDKASNKTKDLLAHHVTNNKLKEVCINRYIIKLESNDELKEINIKNCACYYFNDLIEIEDFDLNNILIDEISIQNVLINDIQYKTLTSGK